MKRRTFLKGAICSAAFPVILPERIFARPGPNEKINLGCIGVGGMGTSNLRAFLGKPEVRVIALCDVDRQHLNQANALVKESYGNDGCRLYSDFRELLAQPDIDAVMIATPDHWHAIIAVAAARAGKDIYAEKPLAYTISEGRAIVNAVQQSGIVWQTGSWQRSQQHFRFACELVRNGRIGNVHTVRVGLPYGNSIRKGSTQPAVPPEYFDYDMWLGPAPWRPYAPARCHWNFRWIRDYSSGQLSDWAGHHCDIANWGMNSEHSAPRYVEGRAQYPPAEDGLFDTAPGYYFECTYSEGFKMIVADSRQQPKGMGAHFIGDEGWVHVNRSGISTQPESLLRSEIQPNEIHLYKSEDHHQNFIDCIRTRQPTVTPVDVAHSAIMIGHLGNIAMRLGRRVEWNLENERFVNDPGADRMLMRPMRGPWHIGAGSI